MKNQMGRKSKSELHEIYGFRAHQVVLYSNEEGHVESDDPIWQSPEIAEEYPYESWRPIAAVICHESDKVYQQPLKETLLNPKEWATEILWLDQDWFSNLR